MSETCWQSRGELDDFYPQKTLSTQGDASLGGVVCLRRRLGDAAVENSIILPIARLQNSRIFLVGLSNECARSSNERSGASVKTESGTGERRVRLARFAREDPRFRREAPCDQRFREKTTTAITFRLGYEY